VRKDDVYAVLSSFNDGNCGFNFAANRITSKYSKHDAFFQPFTRMAIDTLHNVMSTKGREILLRRIKCPFNLKCLFSHFKNGSWYSLVLLIPHPYRKKYIIVCTIYLTKKPKVKVMMIET